MPPAALATPPATRRYRFDGVVVDVAAARLFVDGRERLCSQRALRLLVILCESAGRVMPRQAVIDRLWPGGQIVADEALTQAVFRTRACLDRYADRVVTIRGVGLRLDARVDIEDGSGPSVGSAPARARSDSDGVASEPATPSGALTATAFAAEAPVPPTPTPALDPAAYPPPPPRPDTTAPPPRRTSQPGARRAVMLLVLLAATAILALRFVSFPDPAGSEVIDAGYGIHRENLHPAHADTPALLRDAFAHEAQGDRARGRALLETAHRIDPASPVASMFLALWAAGGSDRPESERWLAEADIRATAIDDPVVSALLAYVHAEAAGSGQDVLRHAGAVLDLRPGAWQMRLARAHLLISEGMREAAREELTSIAFTDLSHRKLAMALADIASLGDVAYARGILDRVAPERDADPDIAYLRGRIAWSERDFDAAHRAFLDAVEVGRRAARFNTVNRALANLGTIAVIRGEIDTAIEWTERARVGMVESRWTGDELDLSLTLAQLHALRGDAAAMRVELQRALDAAARSSARPLRDLAQAVRARLAPDDPPTAPAEDADLALAPLLAAQVALQAGDLAAARSAWVTAGRRLDPGSTLRDEYRWLAYRLGEPVPEADVIDPPYPPLSRFATRLALDRALIAATEQAP